MLIDFVAERCDHPGCERPGVGSWDGGFTIHCAEHLELWAPGSADYVLDAGLVMPGMAAWAAKQKARGDG